jgi:DNA processing protein
MSDRRPAMMRRPSDLGRERSGTLRRSWPAGFAAKPEDRLALLVLLGLASLTPRRLLDLSGRRGTASSCLQAVLHGEAGSDADRAVAASTDPIDVASRLEGSGARLVTVGDPDYPEDLADLFDPPAGVFLRGSLDPVRARVAVVGARNCSIAGAEMASALGSGLARSGVAVVSGGARGIDSAAHRGALESGGSTVAVLGCGIDVPYPRHNRRLLDQIARDGVLITEYPPGTPPEPFRFPARNRIVAGLARAVVVVEGATGSGSMITADHALDLGREVFAVPGPVTSELSTVPLALIREGATLVRGPDDLISDLGLEASAPPPTGPSRPEDGGGRGVGGAEVAVWEALAGSCTPDALAAATGLSLPEVVSALVGLELRGQVLQVGGRYQRRLKSLGLR